MRSRASLKSHPLHPILVGFPIAFFSGTLLFDILALAGENEGFYATAHHLLVAGIVAALVAAIPGFIDFLYTVPPASSARKRAATHGLLNLCMVALFALALLFRPESGPVETVPLLLECGGFVLMLFAGWMGGTLVHRNQIGVDPRYAFAGKWREETCTPSNGMIEVENRPDLKRDQMLLLHVDGKRIVLARATDGLVAFDDHCTHRGGSLAGGMMICDTVQCPWHGSQFSVRTGEVKAGPATAKIRTYPVEVTGDRIRVHLQSIPTATS